MILKLKYNQFLSSITTLASGSLLSQLIAFVCAPILTRLYTPEEMGTYAYLISFVAIFMGIINGKYDMAIVLESDKKNVFALIKLSLIIGVAISLIGTLIFIFFTTLSGNNLEILDVSFIFFVLLSYAIIDTLTAYNNREKEYKIMAKVGIIRSACQNIGAAILGLFKTGNAGLIFPYIIGQYLGIRKQGQTLKNDWGLIKNVNKSELRSMLIKHKRQPIFSAPATLANSFSYSSITIFLKSIFGDTLVGFYSISIRLLGLPLALISGNVSKVFFESAGKEFHATGGFQKSFRKVFLFQLVLAIPLVLIMYFFAPPICELVFGKEWRIAGEYIKILAPMFGIRFIVTSISPAMTIARKQNTELLIQILFVISSIFCYLSCRYLHLPIESYLTIICILYSMVYLICFFIILKISRSKTNYVQ